MFFPEPEFPTPEVEVHLARLGVSCRRLRTATAQLSGFTLKAAALLLSSFNEVLFLDADNVPVRKPIFALSETAALNLYPAHHYFESEHSSIPHLPLQTVIIPLSSPHALRVQCKS